MFFNCIGIQLKTISIWVNGRFLNRKVSGVERVAIELLNSLSSEYLTSEGIYQGKSFRIQFKWALESTSQNTVPAFTKSWDKTVLGGYKGHLWEQLNLARHCPDDWLLNLCNTAPLFRSKQFIFFHDAQVYAIPGNFNWKFRTWYKVLLNVAGRFSNCILTNSKFSLEEIHRYTGIPLHKIRYIHLGSDHMNRLTPEFPEKIREQLASSSYVLAVASASPNKNFQAIIEALKLLNEKAPSCVIVGQQYSQVFQNSTLADSQSLNLVHAGYVTDTQLAGLYQSALCLIYPSFYEGFGLPPLEAMRWGCPVIASQTSSLPEVCGDAVLYCDPSNSQTIAQAIHHLMNHPDQIQNLKAKSIVHTRQFTWQKSAGQLLDVLEEQISKSILSSRK